MYRDFLAAVGSSSSEVLNSAMSPAQKELSNQMYFMLAMAMPADSVGEVILRNYLEAEGAARGGASTRPLSRAMLWLSSAGC